MSKPYLSVIIPVYNEADRLPLTLIDVDKHLSAQDFSYEIIILDKGSTDGTKEIAKRFVPLIKNLRLIDLANQNDKTEAFKQGALTAKGNWRLFMDADNSTAVVEFNKMIPYFSTAGGSYDVIIGSRNVMGAKAKPPLPLQWRILDKITNLFARLILLKNVRDSLCNFKCFSETTLKRIIPLIRLPDNKIFHNEIFGIQSLALAKAAGYQIKEMPVFWSHNSCRSCVKLTNYLNIILEIIKMRWRLLKLKGKS